MNMKFGLLTAGLLAAAIAAPAHATIYSTSFSGQVVSTPKPTGGRSVGTTVSGSLVYSTDAKQFLNFTINGVSAAQPFVSTITISPGGIANPYEALYQASTSIVQGTGTMNTAFALDLLSNTNFTTADAAGILAAPGALETQANSFDGNFSQFSYYTGNATGPTQAFTVALNPASLSTRIPEPASLALLAVSMIGTILRRRR